jgi:hypothetical protein
MGRKKIARLSVSGKLINRLRRKYPEIILKETGVPFKDAYVIYDCSISDIPYDFLIQMLYAWVGGKDKIKKVISKVEFEIELEHIIDEIKKQKNKYS